MKQLKDIKNPERFKPEIDWALDTLKKNNRIQWYVNRLKETELDKGIDERHQLIDSKPELKHYMDLSKNNRNIFNYPFKPQDSLKKVLEDLKKLDVVAPNEKRKVTPKKDQKKIVAVFGWEWWDLNTNGDDEEGKALSGNEYIAASEVLKSLG